MSPEEGVPLLDLTAQYATIEDEIGEALSRVVGSQRFVLGPEVEAFEEAIASYVGVSHAVGVASGTDALLLPLRALEPEPGDEVIVPAFTFFATAGAAWNAGFRPVFCDVDPQTFNLTRATVEAAWSERTRAVIPVHLFGQMAPLEELVELAAERGAVVLEDAAQAIGARRTMAAPGGDPDVPDGGGPPAPVPAMAGSVGEVGAFSFFPTKNLGAFGDAGLVTFRDAELAERVRKLRVHGGRQMYHHEMVGTNSRLDALQAAVLRAKLPHLDAWAAARGENACRYHGLLADLPDVVPPYTDPANHHVFNQYTVRVRRRDELRSFLAERNIGTGIYYPVPLHLQECFAPLGQARGTLPVAETLAEQVLSLPVYPELGEERVERVASAVRDFYGA
ncbi:MAG: DegT/DnrJ/EryC1/StrS family aminotransferase [Gemmatimonadota bacterium]|jgi:dTDP-4-amino-4,6-dideoxygalactose transaminase